MNIEKKYGEGAYQKKRTEYKNAERRAKWRTLFECHEQASDIRFMLEHMDDEETKWMRPEELEKAKKQIIAMDTYFTKAVELAAEKAQTDPDEMAAMKYADRDIVRQAIMHHSDDTYVAKKLEIILKIVYYKYKYYRILFKLKRMKRWQKNYQIVLLVVVRMTLAS